MGLGLILQAIHANQKIEATASQWVLFKRILALAKFQRHWMIFAVVLTIFQSVITAFQPYLYKTVIDQVIIPKQFQLLEKWALILLIWLIVQALLGFANSYLSESIAQSVILKLRQYIYDHLTRLKLSFTIKPQWEQPSRDPLAMSKQSPIYSPLV